MKRIFLKIIALIATLAVGNAQAMDISGWYARTSQAVVDTYNHYRYGSEIYQDAEKRREDSMWLLDRSYAKIKMQYWNNQITLADQAIAIQELDQKRIDSFNKNRNGIGLSPNAVITDEQYRVLTRSKAASEQEIERLKKEKRNAEAGKKSLKVDLLKKDPAFLALHLNENQKLFSWNNLRYTVAAQWESLFGWFTTDIVALATQYNQDKLKYNNHALRVERSYYNGLTAAYDEMHRELSKKMIHSLAICHQISQQSKGTCVDEITHLNQFLHNDVSKYANKYAQEIDQAKQRVNAITAEREKDIEIIKTLRGDEEPTIFGDTFLTTGDKTAIATGLALAACVVYRRNIINAFTRYLPKRGFKGTGKQESEPKSGKKNQEGSNNEARQEREREHQRQSDAFQGAQKQQSRHNMSAEAVSKLDTNGLYELFELNPSASSAEIRANKERIHTLFRELSKQYHPDVNNDGHAHGAMKKINGFYQDLKSRMDN